MDQGQEAPKNCWLKDGMLYFKNGLYIPNDNALRSEITKGYHDSQVAGHFGMEKKVEIVTRDFY